MEPPGDSSTGDEKSVGFESAEKIILRWDSTASEDAREKMIFESDRQEAHLYLQAVDEIQRFLSNTSLSDDQSKATTIQIAMARLEDEFRNILITHTAAMETESLADPASASSSTHSRPSFSSSSFELEEEFTLNTEKLLELHHCESTDSSGYRSTSSIRELDLMMPEAISDLQAIAMRMISAGYLRECIQVYGSVRKSAVDSSFRRLGFEKMSIGDIQRLEWEVLEGKIRRWDVGTNIDDACFMETVKGPAIQLFNFAEAIQKLFKI